MRMLKSMTPFIEAPLDSLPFTCDVDRTLRALDREERHVQRLLPL